MRRTMQMRTVTKFSFKKSTKRLLRGKSMRRIRREKSSRFQHVLDANDREGDKFAGKIIGKLDGQADLFNSKSDNQGRKGFEDSVFVGVSDVMSKAKDMFEAQEEKQLHLLSRDDIKRKANPTALKFEMMTNDEEQSVISPQPKKTDWIQRAREQSEQFAEEQSTPEFPRHKVLR